MWRGSVGRARWGAVAALVAVVVLVIVTGGVRVSRDADATPSGPVAVMLSYPGGGRSELAVIDLDRFAVVRRVPLRSLCLDLDADPAGAGVVTAQTGGVGPGADHALGVYRLGAADVDYVELPTPNAGLTAAAGAKALVVHGFEETAGLCASVVDVRDGRTVAATHVSTSAGRPVRIGQRLGVLVPSTPRAAGTGGRTEPGRLDEVRSDGTTGPVARFDADRVTPVAGADSGGRVVLAGRRRAPRPGDSGWSVFALDLASSRVVSECPVPDVERSLSAGAVVGDRIAVADCDGLDLSAPGDRVVLLDRATLRPAGAIHTGGMPVALAAWRTKLLVADGVRGTLSLYEPGALRPARTLKVSSAPLGAGDLVVLDHEPIRRE